jgi:hypothetical protein
MALSPMTTVFTKPQTETEEAKPRKFDYNAWRAANRPVGGYADAELTRRPAKAEPLAEVIDEDVEIPKPAPRRQLSREERGVLLRRQQETLAHQAREAERQRQCEAAPVATAMPATGSEGLAPEAEVLLKGRRKGRFVSLDDRIAAIEAANAAKKAKHGKKNKKAKRGSSYLEWLKNNTDE